MCTKMEASISGRSPGAGLQRCSTTSWPAPRRAEITSCWESPLREVWLTRRMTSPTWMRPLSAAGCPGNSFLTRTMLPVPGTSPGTRSSRLKLKPRPDVFFSRHTSNTLSGERVTMSRPQHASARSVPILGAQRHANWLQTRRHYTKRTLEGEFINRLNILCAQLQSVDNPSQNKKSPPFSEQ